MQSRDEEEQRERGEAKSPISFYGGFDGIIRPAHSAITPEDPNLSQVTYSFIVHYP